MASFLFPQGCSVYMIDMYIRRVRSRHQSIVSKIQRFRARRGKRISKRCKRANRVLFPQKPESNHTTTRPHPDLTRSRPRHDPDPSPTRLRPRLDPGSGSGWFGVWVESGTGGVRIGVDSVSSRAGSGRGLGRVGDGWGSHWG